MAAPIHSGATVIGVIRCSVPFKTPYYFGGSDISLLELIADQVSHYWKNRLITRELRDENESMRRLVESMAKLNDFVYAELNRKALEERNIFSEALKITHSVIKGAEIMDVRLLDHEKKELYFAEVHGDAWKEGSTLEIQQRRNRRFPVTAKPPQSAGAHVCQTGRPYAVQDTSNDPYYSETFSNVECMLLAPITVANTVVGVLDIRGLQKSPFPKSAEASAELLGRQLGLYHYLATLIGELRGTELELSQKVKALDDLQKQQAQTFEDMGHQLKGPLLVAQDRVDSMLKYLRMPGLDVEDSGPNSTLQKKLHAVRGLCTKAEKVVKNIRLFADLVRGASLKPNLSRLGPDDLLRKLVVAALDYENITNPERRLRFIVRRDGFRVLDRIRVSADFDWLDQSVYTLLDNASKYSFDESVVQIAVGLTGTRRFYISVLNKGIRIRPGEISFCVQRGWRSEEAKSTTGEGTGSVSGS